MFYTHGSEYENIIYYSRYTEDLISIHKFSQNCTHYMIQVCIHGRWTWNINVFYSQPSSPSRLKTCIATLLLATKNADMVDDDTAVLEGPEGKTRDADWGFRYLHIVEKVKCQDVIYDHAVCSPSGKTLFQNPCIHIISSIFSYA